MKLRAACIHQRVSLVPAVEEVQNLCALASLRLGVKSLPHSSGQGSGPRRAHGAGRAGAPAPECGLKVWASVHANFFAVPSPNFIPCCEDFPRARRNWGQGNKCQGNVGHSADAHSPDKAVLANLGVLWVEDEQEDED